MSLAALAEEARVVVAVATLATALVTRERLDYHEVLQILGMRVVIRPPGWWPRAPVAGQPRGRLISGISLNDFTAAPGQLVYAIDADAMTLRSD